MTPNEQKLADEIWTDYLTHNDDFILMNTEAYGYINYIKDEKAKAVRKAIDYAVVYMGNLEK